MRTPLTRDIRKRPVPRIARVLRQLPHLETYDLCKHRPRIRNPLRLPETTHLPSRRLARGYKTRSVSTPNPKNPRRLQRHQRRAKRSKHHTPRHKSTGGQKITVEVPDPVGSVLRRISINFRNNNRLGLPWPGRFGFLTEPDPQKQVKNPIDS